MLEAALRDDLAPVVKRVMAVVNPLKITITNYPDEQIEYLEAPYNNDNPDLGLRKIPFSKHLYIEKDDFILAKPNKKYKRLALDIEVRLFQAYFVRANEVIYDGDGNIVEVLVTYDIETKSGSGFKERKPNGTIHFVEASQGIKAKFNFFDAMIKGDSDQDLIERFNKDSWLVKQGYVERSLVNTKIQDKYQFMRNGYFNTDTDSKVNNLIFNEIVPLKRSYK